MERSCILKVDYDSKNDILYLDFMNTHGNSYADDEAPVGIEIMRDIDTDEVTGLMVYYAMRDMAERQSQIEGMGYRNIRIKELLPA